jgi:hypothetical protein
MANNKQQTRSKDKKPNKANSPGRVYRSKQRRINEELKLTSKASYSPHIEIDKKSNGSCTEQAVEATKGSKTLFAKTSGHKPSENADDVILAKSTEQLASHPKHHATTNVATPSKTLFHKAPKQPDNETADPTTTKDKPADPASTVAVVDPGLTPDDAVNTKVAPPVPADDIIEIDDNSDDDEVLHASTSDNPIGIIDSAQVPDTTALVNADTALKPAFTPSSSDDSSSTDSSSAPTPTDDAKNTIQAKKLTGTKSVSLAATVNVTNKLTNTATMDTDARTLAEEPPSPPLDCSRYSLIITIPPSEKPWIKFIEILRKTLKFLQDKTSKRIWLTNWDTEQDGVEKIIKTPKDIPEGKVVNHKLFSHYFSGYANPKKDQTSKVFLKVRFLTDDLRKIPIALDKIGQELW